MQRHVGRSPCFCGVNQTNVSHRNSMIIDNIHMSSPDHSMSLYDNGMLSDDNGMLSDDNGMLSDDNGMLNDDNPSVTAAITR
ncbi:MAG: hypothetical protein ACFE0J_04460 [Elainellaceae cyanobacterium]